MKNIFLFLFSFPIILTAGNENLPPGARATGMGNTGLTISDVWSTHYNQGGLANVKLISAGVSYQSRFLQKDMGIQSFAFVLPVKNGGAFGLNYTGFGGKLYNQSKIGLSYGLKFTPNVSAGISINYHMLRLGNNYGNSSAFTFEAGILAKITEELSLGFHIFNPTQSKLNDYQDEIIPTVIRLGLKYDFSKKVLTQIEVEKDIDFSPVYKIGIEYHPSDILYVRTGISSNPSMPSIGIGLKLENFSMDLASTFHPVLGITPAFSLLYTFDK